MAGEPKFEVGETVRLKSGGPDMTVAKILRMEGVWKGDYRCKWFTDNEPGSGSFPEKSLERVTDEDD